MAHAGGLYAFWQKRLPELSQPVIGGHIGDAAMGTDSGGVPAVLGSHIVVAVVAVVACNACNARIAYNARNAGRPGSVQRAMTSWLVVVSRHLAPVIRGSLHES